MNNPFKISDDKLKTLLAGYDAWLESDPKEAAYPGIFREQGIKVRKDFLNAEQLEHMSDDALYEKIYKYSRKLEGPVHMRLGEKRLLEALSNIRRNLKYIITTSDTPFKVAQEVLEGNYKIDVFAKAFWSPIFQARFPDVLPNWNNKTEKFLKKFDINITTSKLSIFEKYRTLSEAFTFLRNLTEGQDFYTINHLMHYGTVIPEGKKLIEDITGNVEPDSIKSIIEKYKQHIRTTELKDELYKWRLLKKFQGRPYVNVDDFKNEITTVDYSNLVYPMAISVKNFIAEKAPEEYRSAFKDLFREDEDLNSRIPRFTKAIDNIYSKIGGKHGNHHDERTISTFLTYHNPNIYTFFKDSFYKAFCKILGIKAKSKGEKYGHYLELISDFIDQYINPDDELLNLANGFLTDDCYIDENHLILAQDILFTMFEKKPESLTSEEKIVPSRQLTNKEPLTLSPDSMAIPLNSILYGPPGTGKTYHSISHAVAIIDNENIDDVLKRCESDRESVKKRYEELVKTGQIVFCTFHQSMGYEDFIEGIKPILDEEENNGNPQLIYNVKDGIFKNLCLEASFSYVQKQATAETKRVLDFSEQYDQFVIAKSEQLDQGETPGIFTISNQKLIIDNISQKNNLTVRHENGARTYIVSKQRLSKLAQAFPNLNTIANINDQFRSVIGGSNASAYWAVLNAIRKKYGTALFNPKLPLQDKDYSPEAKMDAVETLENENYKIYNPKRYVLIIDEINRGNVAQIFGELITLIESDKRLGNKEVLKATLPYSGKKLGVPRNLYIVGTMNTADRSVEALDTALRRRFSFIHMKPEVEKLPLDCDGINLQKLLETLNRRLRILKDEDHTIGHAWLIKVKSIEQLKAVFANKILPLLLEYFYNDYEKLGLVLGDAFFVIPHERVGGKEFASFSGSNGLAGQYNSMYIYKFKNPSDLTKEDFLTLTTAVTDNEI